MKKVFSLLLACLLLLVPVLALADPVAYTYSVPTVYSNDAMVEVFAVTYKAGKTDATDYVCVPTDYASAAAIAADYGVAAAAVVSQGSFLRYDISLSDIGSLRLSSGKFSVSYDTTKLELPTYTNEFGNTALKSELFNKGSEWVVNATEGEFLASIAYGHAAVMESTVVYSLYFTVLAGAKDGDVIAIHFTATELGLTNAAEEMVDTNSYTISGVDGAITIGGTPAPVIDKAALQAVYNADKALYDASAVGDPKTMVDGTSYLTVANAATDKAALEAAAAVLNNANATQAEVDAAVTALNKAFVAPSVVKIDLTNLNNAITYAQAFIASADYAKCSDELKAKWTAALTAAQNEQTNRTHTQTSCDNAATAVLALKKTGESTLIYVLAGMGILALVGLGYVVIRRRRFN